MRRSWFPAVAASAALLTLVGKPAAAADGGGRVWDCCGAHGTAEQVGRAVNSQVEQAWTRIGAAREAIEKNARQIGACRDFVVAKVRQTPAYQARAAEAAVAKGQLDAARAASDNGAALAAGSRLNLARQDLEAMEAAALKADFYYNDAKAATKDLKATLARAEASCKVAATWRSKTVMAFENGQEPQWPLALDAEFYVRQAVVAEAGPTTVRLAVAASEPTSYQKNFGGDGIGLVTVKVHPFLLKVPRTPGRTWTAGDRVDVGGCYRATAELGTHVVQGEDCPEYAGAASTDGDLSEMLRALGDVKGVPASYLADVDRDARAEVAKAIAAHEKAAGKPPPPRAG